MSRKIKIDATQQLRQLHQQRFHQQEQLHRQLQQRLQKQTQRDQFLSTQIGMPFLF